MNDDIDLQPMHKFFAALHQLRMNYPTDDGCTLGQCVTDGCFASARGGGYCAHCCQQQIADLTDNPELAEGIHSATATAHRLICEAVQGFE